MQNNFYRKRYIKLIGDAVSHIHSASTIDHPETKERLRETIVENLLKPILPEQFKFGNGKIVDNRENESRDMDLLIYSKTFLPPLIYGEKDDIFPIESCFYAIEIKSKANKKEMEDSYQKAKSIFNLLIPDLFKVRIGKINFPIVPGLFCFDTDLDYDDKNDLDRYCEIDIEGRTNPSIRFICVVGKGYWNFNQAKKEWIFCPPTEDYGEILSAMSDISNTLIANFNNRTVKNFGYYLINDK